MVETTDRSTRATDVTELYDLLARLSRGVDRRDFNLIVSCYTEDSLDEHGYFSGTGAEFADYICNGQSPISSAAVFLHHLLGQSSFDVDGDSAFGETYQAMHMLANGRLFLGIGRYLDTFARRDGRWLLKHRKVVFEWTGFLESTQVGPTGEPSGRFDAEDPLYEFVARLT